MKYYAGRQVKLNGKVYSVGEEIPDATKLRFLEAMTSSGVIYAVPTGQERKKLPPHVLSRLKTKEFHDNIQEPKAVPETEAGAKARENHENDTTVKRSRAEAEVSEAMSKVVASKGTLKRDLASMKKAEMSFGKSVVDESKATTPDKDEEKPKDTTEEPAQEPQTPDSEQNSSAPGDSHEEKVEEAPKAPKEDKAPAAKAKRAEPKKTTAKAKSKKS